MREVGLTAEAGEGWYARWRFIWGAYWEVRRRGDRRRFVNGRGGGIVFGLSESKIAVLSLQRNY